MNKLKAIPGFPGYAASRDGRIWSKRALGRDPKTGRLCTKTSTDWHELKPSLDTKGYQFVVPCVDARLRIRRVHSLVLLAWRGPPKKGEEACHRNGNRADPRLRNLRWGTRASNHADKRRHGTDNRGERNTHAKLTAADVLEMLRLKKSGTRNVDLAKKYQIHPVHVSNICRGASWEWIVKDAPLFAQVHS